MFQLLDHWTLQRVYQGLIAQRCYRDLRSLMVTCSSLHRLGQSSLERAHSNWKNSALELLSRSPSYSIFEINGWKHDPKEENFFPENFYPGQLGIYRYYIQECLAINKSHGVVIQRNSPIVPNDTPIDFSNFWISFDYDTRTELHFNGNETELLSTDETPVTLKLLQLGNQPITNYVPLYRRELDTLITHQIPIYIRQKRQTPEKIKDITHQYENRTEFIYHFLNVSVSDNDPMNLYTGESVVVNLTFLNHALGTHYTFSQRLTEMGLLLPADIR